MRKIGLVLALSVATAASAYAADTTQEVKFKAGASSSTIKASLKGYDGNNYILGANAGQAMSVLFSPDNSSCNFNVYAPGNDTAIFMAEGNEFSANLSATGNYRVQVFLMRNAARRNETCDYSVTFEIGG